MKTKIKQTLTGIALAGAIGLATQSFAQTPAEEKINYSAPTLEYSCENSCSDECAPFEIPRKNSVPTNKNEFKEFYVKAVVESVSDEVFDYRDVIMLNGLLEEYENQNKERTEENETRVKIVKPSDEIRKLLTHYPGLVQTKEKVVFGITYPSTQNLSLEEEKVLNNIGYENSSHKRLKIHDLVLAYDCFNIDGRVSLEKAGISKVSFLKDKTLVQHRHLFESYLENFYKYENDLVLKRRWTIGLGEAGLGALDYKVNQEDANTIGDSIEEVVVSSGNKIHGTNTLTDGSRWPIPMKFPTWSLLFTIPIGCAGPFVRTKLLNKYIRREYDPFDLVENLVNGMSSGILLNSLHPWVFPISILAPIAFEPIRKWTGWRWVKNRR